MMTKTCTEEGKLLQSFLGLPQGIPETIDIPDTIGRLPSDGRSRAIGITMQQQLSDDDTHVHRSSAQLSVCPTLGMIQSALISHWVGQSAVHSYRTPFQT